MGTNNVMTVGSGTVGTPVDSSTKCCVTYSYEDSVKKYLDWLHENGSLIIKKNAKRPHFSGFFSLSSGTVYIKRVIYSDPATIVFWSDGTKTVSKCHAGDEYSPECGLILCTLKKLVGANHVRELLSDWVTYEDIVMDIKDVRNKHRDDK